MSLVYSFIFSYAFIIYYLNLKDPPDPDRSYSLQLANVSVCDTVSYQLLIDLELLYEMAKELTEENGKGDQRGYQALYTGNQMINAIQAGDIQYSNLLLSSVYF